MQLYCKALVIVSMTLALSACSSTSTKNLLGKPAKGYQTVAAITPPLVVPQPLSRSQFKQYNAAAFRAQSSISPHVSLVPPGSHLKQYEKEKNIN